MLGLDDEVGDEPREPVEPNELGPPELPEPPSVLT